MSEAEQDACKEAFASASYHTDYGSFYDGFAVGLAYARAEFAELLQRCCAQRLIIDYDFFAGDFYVNTVGREQDDVSADDPIEAMRKALEIWGTK